MLDIFSGKIKYNFILIFCHLFKRNLLELIDWLIDFNGISTHLELFYAYIAFSVRSHLHLMFSLWGFLCLFVFFLAYDPIEHVEFLNRSIWLLDGTPAVTITPGLSEFRSNGNEGVLYILKIEIRTLIIRYSLVSYLRHTHKHNIYKGISVWIGVFFRKIQDDFI